MYYASGLGVTAGWHRLFTHKGYVARSSVRNTLAFCGSLALEGSLSSWVSNHRAHHANTDTAGDPHSPWTKKGLVRGLWHAHVGWLSTPGAESSKWARDIESDSFCKMVSRYWVAISLAGMLLPAVVAGVFGGVSSFVGMLVWAGVVRVVLLHHVTWSTNSICHVLGRRPNKTSERSGNVWWLSILSFGESWHNNHHSQPRLARHQRVHGAPVARTGNRGWRFALFPGAWASPRHTEQSARPLRAASTEAGGRRAVRQPERPPPPRLWRP